MSAHGPFSSAWRAAATARSTSTALASAIEVISRPVAGSKNARLSEDLGSPHSPPMSRRGFFFRNWLMAGDGVICGAMSAGANDAFTGALQELRISGDFRRYYAAWPHG